MKFRLFFLVLLAGCTASVHQKPTPAWLDNKYSMFIHFGLYSHFGGEYQGQPVTGGYSEQIQAFAPIPAGEYEAAAGQFNPVQWDPHHVVEVAKKAGMRSIVFTAKHHDGFCMYHSAYTPFNIVEATPYGRDAMGELAAACREGGMAFGVYFSLIDWHFPQANPMSGHNADPITPEHHRLNLRQVEEILTGYGPVSEIWFDMGSLTVEQSRELYQLVTLLQPGCMVSGRLGNDFGDFSVMADNQIPDYHLAVPWQTPASVFRETWGYRRWQERGALQPKVDEKIRSLVHVIGRGGNFLLNVGPRPDGSLVPFEKELLVETGRWVSTHSRAIYGTRPNPFGQIFPWGEVTAKDDSLYLFVMKEYAGQTIHLPRIRGAVQSVRMLSGAAQPEWRYAAGEFAAGEFAAGEFAAGEFAAEEFAAGEFAAAKSAAGGSVSGESEAHTGLLLQMPARFTSCCEVLEIVFEDGYTLLPEKPISFVPQQEADGGRQPGLLLNAGNAAPHFGHSALNYYAGYKSLIAYEWTVNVPEGASGTDDPAYLLFTKAEAGRPLRLEMDGTVYEITLGAESRSGMSSDSVVVHTDSSVVRWGNLYHKPGRGVFGFVEEEGLGLIKMQAAAGWEQVEGFEYGIKQTMDLPQRRGVLFLQEIWADEAQTAAVEIGSGNGVYVLLNGEYLTAHCMPERLSYQRELLLLPLQKGVNQLLIKYYNAFEDALHYSIKPEWQWTEYRRQLPFGGLEPGWHTITMRPANPPSAVAPLRAGNLQFVVR